jgi:diguanylate cyclase (GGDEF)-like protein/PAS domain S-box-containing protein
MAHRKQETITFVPGKKPDHCGGTTLSPADDFSALFRGLPDASLLVDGQRGKILDVNDAAIRLYGSSRAELLQLRYRDLLAGSAPNDEDPVPGLLCIQQHRKGDGTVLPVEIVAGTMHRHEQPVLLYSVRDITEGVRLEKRLREENAHLKFLAYHDALTGLPNRLLFLDRLEHALAIAQRMDHQVALLYIDVDHFKTVNDSFGHETGDRLLCQVAERLGAGLRKADTLARMAGDEFLIILEKVTGTGQIAQVVRKIRKSLAAGFTIGEQKIDISVSIGGSLFPLHGTDPESLLRHADQALLLAKEQGKNTCRFGTES